MKFFWVKTNLLKHEIFKNLLNIRGKHLEYSIGSPTFFEWKMRRPSIRCQHFQCPRISSWNLWIGPQVWGCKYLRGKWKWTFAVFGRLHKIRMIFIILIFGNVPVTRVTQKDVYSWKFQLWLWLKSYLFQITTTHYSVYGRPFTRVSTISVDF